MRTRSYTDSKRQRKTLIIVAIIGALATIFAATINIMPDLIASSLLPTNTSVPVLDTGSSPTAEILPVEIIDMEGLEMVLVPEGEFKSFGDTAPIVYLQSFYIDKYEVTNDSYKRCANLSICSIPKDISSSTRQNYYDSSLYDNFPVINVDWEQAKTFCEWRGAKLPNGYEWEKAAGGTDGRYYPWGDNIDKRYANYNNYIGDTTEVGSYKRGVSPYGGYDMAGNVWEWVMDYYTENSITYRHIRGGSWDVGDMWVPVFFYTASRETYFNNTIGFRCVRNANP